MATLSVSLSATNNNYTSFSLHFNTPRSPIRLTCSAAADKHVNESIRTFTCGILAVWAVTTASPVIAANQRLPPLSTDPDRCERAFVGNTIGQANGVYDKAIDLRFCDYTNEKSKLKGKSLAAALMSDAKLLELLQ